MSKKYSLGKLGFDYDLEFNFYVDAIRKSMSPDGSFLELGPGELTISDFFPDVTLFDKDIEIIGRYAKRGKKVLHGNYHSLVLPHDAYDYVVAIHPELSDSGRNIEWINPEECCFRFNGSSLDGFVSSLIDVSRRNVFIASKIISENPPMNNCVIIAVTRPYPYVFYEKPKHEGDKNGEFKHLSNSPDAV